MSVADMQADLGLRTYRASLRAALRTGDALGAARAWARLRFAARQLSAYERAAGREARLAVGRAIRDARYRRMQSAMDAFGPAKQATDALAPSPRRRLIPIAIALVALSVIALLIVFLTMRPADEDYAPAAAPPPEAATDPTPFPTLAVAGRGRTAATPAPVAVATVVPVTTPEATASATAPASSARPTTGSGTGTGGTAGGVAGGVTGGVTGGTPGGVVGGVPGGTGTKTLPPATPSPTPYVLPARPPALPPGSDRFQFIVLDQATGLPLANVCVNFGFQTCGPSDPHTSSSGYYWLDLNPGMATSWNFKFFLDGYLTATVNKTYRPGMGTTTTTVFLRHT